jgi:hypothetical protein
MVAWNHDYKPRNHVELYQFEQLCIESIRIDALELDLIALKRRKCDCILQNWDHERTIAAAQLAEELPTAPERIARELQRTVQGCDLMIQRWESLLDAHITFTVWDAAQVRMALDLLGVHPDLRRSCRRIGTQVEHDFVDGQKKLKPDRDTCWKLAQVEVARLRQLRETLVPQDELERQECADGIGLEVTAEEKLVMRYLAAAKRRYLLFQKELTRKLPQTRVPLVAEASIQPPDENPPWRWQADEEAVLSATLAEREAAESGEKAESPGTSTPRTRSPQSPAFGSTG